jgi:hypothetical protein
VYTCKFRLNFQAKVATVKGPCLRKRNSPCRQSQITRISCLYFLRKAAVNHLSKNTINDISMWWNSRLVMSLYRGLFTIQKFLELVYVCWYSSYGLILKTAISLIQIIATRGIKRTVYDGHTFMSKHRIILSKDDVTSTPPNA